MLRGVGEKLMNLGVDRDRVVLLAVDLDKEERAVLVRPAEVSARVGLGVVPVFEIIRVFPLHSHVERPRRGRRDGDGRAVGDDPRDGERVFRLRARLDDHLGMERVRSRGSVRVKRSE